MLQFVNSCSQLHRIQQYLPEIQKLPHLLHLKVIGGPLNEHFAILTLTHYKTKQRIWTSFLLFKPQLFVFFITQQWAVSGNLYICDFEQLVCNLFQRLNYNGILWCQFLGHLARKWIKKTFYLLICSVFLARHLGCA